MPERGDLLEGLGGAARRSCAAFRLTRSLGHRDWTRAREQVDEFAAGFVSRT